MIMENTPVRYHVLHETSYDYGGTVSLSQQQLHLSPRILAWQQIEEQLKNEIEGAGAFLNAYR